MNFPNLTNAKTVVYDTETTGLDWKRDEVVGHVITLGSRADDSFYFPVRHRGGANLDPEKVEGWLRKDLAPRKDIKLVGHNLKFDLHFGANSGLNFATRDLECTMINAALCDENAGRYNLETQAKQFGVEPKKSSELYEYLASIFGGEPTHKQMEHFCELAGDDAMANEYAKGDGTSTYQLWAAQQEQLDYEGLRKVHGVECRVIRTLFRMERRGVPVDEARLDWFEGILNQKQQDADEALPEGLNVRSGPQMRKLMEANGHTDWPLTAKGNPSFPEEWLKTNETGRHVVRKRKITNMKNSFTEPLRERHLFNGKVYTQFNQLKMDDFGTVSGRLSSSDPNMQQVPKRDKEFAPLFRSVFVPEKGKLWSANDYGQQEFVVFTEYTRNPTLVAGYKATPIVDIHSSVAQMLNVERDPTAKRLNLGQVYGMGAATLALKLGCSLSEAKDYNRRYHNMIPEAKPFLKKAESRAKSRGYVYTFLERRRRFPDSRFAHKAGNGIIQGSSADITKVKMVEVDEYFEAETNDECGLILQIHDELDWMVPPEMKAHDDEARRIMKSFGPDDMIQMDIPIQVDGDIATDWGRASFPKFDFGAVE